MLLPLLARAAVEPAKPAGGGDSPAPNHAVSVKDSPGYVPLVDPESTSVTLGRRTNAPLVRMPFHGGARSLDDLGRAVCRALHRGDRDELMSLCVADSEFRVILWREFPQSRPATGLTWVDAWTILYARLHAGAGHAVRDHGGHVYEFMGFEAGEVVPYKNFRLHNGLTMLARDDEGNVQTWTWLRSVAERKGVFKIYSTED
jgi:hypothetical protein